MHYDHIFTLYVKGEQKDIDSFMQTLKEKWPSDSQDWTEPGDKPNSLKFYRTYFKRSYNYAEDLLPYMREYTAEKGRPLSFFLAASNIESDQMESICGYRVYDGGTLARKHQTQWSKGKKSIEREFESTVKGALEQWLGAGQPEKPAPVVVVDKATKKKQAEWLKRVIERKGLWSEVRGSDTYSKVLTELMTEEYCLELAQADGRTLASIPPALKTGALCVIAVQENGRALEFVPPELKTEALCLSAVQKYGWALRHVPKVLRTEAVCLAAVQQEGSMLKYVPEAARTEAVCLAAVKSGGDLELVPEAVKTEAICLAAVQGDGSRLKHVPEVLRTEVLCVEAMKSNRYAMDYVPDALKAKVEAAMKKVAQDETAEAQKKSAQKTPEQLLAEVQENGEALKDILDALKTEALCLAAVQQGGHALEYVPEALKTEALCLAAVQQLWYALQYVPEALKTEALCLAAVQQHWGALQYVPEALKTEALCLVAARQDKGKRATRYNACSMDYIPKKLQAKIKAALKEDKE